MRKLLFTPGPLNCSMKVKQKMLYDSGSRDFNFIKTIKNVRKKLLNLSTKSANADKFTSILIPGSGTYAIESVLSSVINKNNKLGILINGAYGERMNEISKIHNINTELIRIPENKSFNYKYLKQFSSNVSHIAVVHCETTTGILNDIKSISDFTKKYNKKLIVDAMSSFGGIPIDMCENNINYLISSSNKCLHGPPGLSFCIANKNDIKSINNKPRTLSLDLKKQWEFLNTHNQFRFTPPTHIINGLDEALNELNIFDDISKREKQYKKYNIMIREEIKKLGFKKYTVEEESYIISTWHYPEEFDFNHFYNFLEKNDILIYPGKLSNEKVFRIGNIGNLKEEDIEKFLLNVNKYKTNYL